MIRAALAVALKELRQIRRDRRTLLIVLFVPVLFLLLYGYALNFDIRHVSLAVEDRDDTAASRALVSAFADSGYFDLVSVVRSGREIDALVNHNRARVVLTVPARFGRDMAQGRQVRVQAIVDGDNANTASTVVGYVEALVGQYSAARGGSAPLISVEPRIWYNPQLRSALFLVPGLIAYIAMITAVVSSAVSVVREKELGTMEQVRMAPVNPLAYIAGKTMPYLVISFASGLLIILASMALFDLPMRGSWMHLTLAIGLFLLGAQAQGLLISTIAETQQVAFQVALLSSFLPTFILSGFIFPLSSMPAAVQGVTYLVPARYFLVALRAIVLKGAGLAAFWPELAALGVFALAATVLASLRLRAEWS